MYWFIQYFFLIKAALVLDKHIKDRTAVKTYIARVIGEFPK